jgi:hypothetical protein
MNTYNGQKCVRELCPICGAPIPAVPIGRPRKVCSYECRNEQKRRRRAVDSLEQELDETRRRFAAGWSLYTADHVRGAEERVAHARARLAEGSREE